MPSLRVGRSGWIAKSSGESTEQGERFNGDASAQARADSLKTVFLSVGYEIGYQLLGRGARGRKDVAVLKLAFVHENPGNSISKPKGCSRKVSATFNVCRNVSCELRGERSLKLG